MAFYAKNRRKTYICCHFSCILDFLKFLPYNVFKDIKIYIFYTIIIFRRYKMQTKSISKKILIAISFCLVLAIALCACETSKTAVSADDFKSKAEASGLMTEDNTAQFKDYDHVVSAITAVKVENSSALWTTDFVVANSEDKAKGMFESNKEDFDKISGTSTSTSVGNYDTYERTGDGKYMYLCRVDKTLLYANVDEKYKDEFKAFAEKLGY